MIFTEHRTPEVRTVTVDSWDQHPDVSISLVERSDSPDLVREGDSLFITASGEVAHYRIIDVDLKMSVYHCVLHSVTKS